MKKSSDDAIAGPLRSWLFVPGDRDWIIDKACRSNADAIIVDLEDAVALSDKERARALVAEVLAPLDRPNLYVRINALTTPYAFADIGAIVRTRPAGIMLPKPESETDVRLLDWLITQYEREAGISAGAIGIVPLVETAAGMAAMSAIAAASPRLRCLAFGAGDFTLDLDLHWSADEEELHPYRSQMVLASRAAGLKAPIDVAWVKIAEMEGLERSAQRAKAHGFQGKLCIHPSHVDAIHRAYQPSDQQIAHAREVLAAFDEAESRGVAAIQVDGQLIDYPIVAMARRVVADAERFIGTPN